MTCPPDRVGKYLAITCGFGSSEEIQRFMRAAVEIESELPGTVVQIVNLADYQAGEPPPANESPEAGFWYPIGIVCGPKVEDVEDSHLDAGDTQWGKKVLDILEEFGLHVEPEVTQ